MKNREYYSNRNTYSELWKEVNTTTDEDVLAEGTQSESPPTAPEATPEPTPSEPVGDPSDPCPEPTQEDAISLSNKIVRILENKESMIKLVMHYLANEKNKKGFPVK